MNFKRTCYIVFVFILCTIFNMEVKAMAGEGGTGLSTGRSCLYYDDKNAYKLEIDETGSLTLYEPTDGKKSTVISKEGNVSWSGQWVKSKKSLPLYNGVNSSTHMIKTINISGKQFNSCPEGLVDNEQGAVIVVEVDDGTIETQTYHTVIERKDDIGDVVEHTGVEDLDYYDNISKSCNSVENIKDMWLNESKDNYHASCLYSYDAGNQCILVQLDIRDDGKIEVSRNGEGSIDGIYKELDSSFNDNYIKENGGWCPRVWIRKETEIKTQNDIYTTLSMSSQDKNNWVEMDILNQSGKNYIDSNLDMTEYDYEGSKIIFMDNAFSCSNIEESRISDLLKLILKLVKILVPILLVVLGSLDFGSAIFSGDDSNMKKAQAKFIKRVIIAVVIFLVPSMLKVLLTIAGTVWSSISADLCGIL